jgi:hypothetical protein
MAEPLVTALFIVWVDLAGRSQTYNAVAAVISAAGT